MRNNRLICCQKSSGPAFGWNDLVIADRCDINAYSLSDFPCTYNRQGSAYKQDSQESRASFSGATQGLKFKVIEYEVFKVEFS